MAEFNTYPVFVADQVLTADHLNEIVNYLDEQDRLTRNKLIGIGIVCGLELKTSTEQIEISKGCGVTSEGYLIVHDQATYTHYHPYNLPDHFSPGYKPVYENWQMWELLTTENSLNYNDAVFIKNNVSFMKNKVVVLLLEMKEKPLKNCIEMNCDDKGDKVEFNVKPLLVDKSDLNKFIKSTEEKPVILETRPSVPVQLHSIQLRRFNVPVKQLNNTNDVLNAFLQIVDENTLKTLAEVLNYCFFHYQPILGEEINPFGSVFEKFKNTRELIKTSNPFFIQYYYDWIDDIINAYYEFKGQIFDVQAVCCPDEGLFPLHLMLGEANKDTVIDRKSKYRNYFIYSPLFSDQKDRLEEVQMLFGRLKMMVENFTVPNPNTFFNALVKITPSRFYDQPISHRSIPYYYDPLGLYQVWSWNKTRKGNENFILSYNAAHYNRADSIVYPLKYDIERFNFFRIEGHIGKPFSNALTSVINQRDQNNLPFDVVALSTATISQFFKASDYQCQFNDLDSIYKVLLAELQCKLGDFECQVSRIPYQLTFSSDLFSENFASFNITDSNSNTNANTNLSVSAAEALKNIMSSGLTINVAATQPPDYVRGDFMKDHCTINKGSIGEAYLNAVKNGVFFTKPSEFSRKTNVFITNASNGLNFIYAYLFYFIDTIENTFAVALNKTLEDFDANVFSARYKTLMNAVGDLSKVGEYLEELDPNDQTYSTLLNNLRSMGFYDFFVQVHALLHACLDERLAALKAEYDQRKNELQLLTNFMNYFKKHPGMEHKAGVPKGGTFILVYHETPLRKLIADFTLAGNLTANLPGALSSITVENKNMANIDQLIQTSYVQDPQLLKNFQLALNKFVNTCNDMDQNTKNQIQQVLVGIPAEPAPLQFRVPEQTVIADFYVPYICCSDCPPVSYVVPKAPVDVLSISIQPTEFCNDDEKVYPVRVTPQGGQLTASAGGVAEEKFEFAPKGINAGVDTLTYTLPDGRSTSIDIQITASFSVTFKYKVADDGLTVQFTPGNGAKDREVLWDFGDGNTSTELSPQHAYQFDSQEQAFQVVLTVTYSPCMAIANQEITLTKPAPPAFDLLPGVFCVKDTKEYEFKINPFPAKLSEITNKDNLVINLDAANKKLTLVPSKQKIKTTKDFHLEYQGIGLDVRVVVADASFFMNIEQNGNDYVLALRPKQGDATNFVWNVAQGNVNISSKTPEMKFSLTERKLNPDQDINIVLSVSYQLPSGNCGDRKEFILTGAIIRKHVGQGEFDNTTKA